MIAKLRRRSISGCGAWYVLILLSSVAALLKVREDLLSGDMKDGLEVKQDALPAIKNIASDDNVTL